MKKILKLLLFTYIFISVLTACKNESASIKESIFYTNLEITLDSLIPELITFYKAPAVGVGIIKDGEIEFAKVYGNHQIGKVAPQNTLFNIASITKPIVATAILKLVQNGDWNLDEPLAKYWIDPDILSDSLHQLLTTRHCLSHTTGFKNWRWLNEDKKLDFDFKPGERFQYSGEGMEYLRKAVENKFNKSLDKIVQDLVFEPAEMNDVTMSWISANDSVRFAHWFDSQGKLHNLDFKTDKVNAADDLIITVEDLSKFGIAVMNKQLISGSIYHEMLSSQSKINTKVNQGLGWVLYDGLTNEEVVINHDGGDPGVTTTLILFPNSKNGIIVFVNSDNGRGVCNDIIQAVSPIGKQIINGLYFENELPETIQITDKKLNDYAGVYDTNQNFEIEFIKKDNYLITESSIFPKLKLFPMSENQFYNTAFELYFKFEEKDGQQQMFFINKDKKVELESTKR